MFDTDTEDSLTTLNTALNKSMVLMDNSMDRDNKTKKVKSIKINTKAQPPNQPSSTPEVVRRKSILKKSRSLDISNSEETIPTNNDKEVIARERHSSQQFLPRPQNLQDFLKRDNIIAGPTLSTFNLDDLSDSEELWVMNVPKTVNPRTLKGQTLLLGEKSKLKIGEGRYSAVNQDRASRLTCIFGTGNNTKPFKAVNIKPAGSVAVRRKLPGIMKRTADIRDSSSVPFPQNLRIRHPFFGPTSNEMDT